MDMVETAYYVGKPAWHQKGLVLEPGQVKTAAEALVAGGCDWLVRKEPVYYFNGSEYSQIEDQYAIIRDKDETSLGIVGGTFVPLQNKEAFEWFDPLVSEGIFQYEAGGSLKKGSVIWVLASRPDSVDVKMVVEGDKIKRYFLLTFGHDGKLAIHLGHTDYRVECWNMLQCALNAGGLISIRHSSKMYDALDIVQQMVIRESEQFEATVEQYQKLAELGCDKELLRKYVRTVFYGEKFQEDEEKGARTVGKIINLFKHYDIDTRTVSEGRSMWDGLNAISYYLTHEYGRTDDSRLSNLWAGNGARIMSNAVQVGLELAA